VTAPDVLRERLAARLAAARSAPARPGIEPRDGRTGPAPLSAAQARMWLATQLEPGSPTYNVPTVLRLRGALDVPALMAALRDLVDRHEVLRGVVAERGGGPVAVTRPASEVPVRYEDLSGRPEAELQRRLEAEAVRPFALDRECPTRAVCYRVAAGDHALALTIHHIATDAWSQRLLVDDLAALYATRTGAAAAPSPPRLSYADVAAHERDHRDPEREAASLAWWRDRLGGAAPVLDLPADRPRPPVPDPDGGVVPAGLPADLSARVRALAADSGGTVFMVQLAAWLALLARISGAGTPVVGVTTAGRRHPDTEAVVGCFVETVPLAVDVTGDLTVRDLLRRARDRLLDGLAHADVPLERIIEAVRPPRLLGTTPLFQVLVNSYQVPPARQSWPGLVAEPSETGTGTAKFDLSLNLFEDGGRTADPEGALRGQLGYRTGLFDRASADRLAGWYANLLAGFAADPDRPVGAVPLAPVTGPLLTGPRRDHPLHRTVPELIDDQIRRWPARTAVVAGGGTLDYATLGRRADRVAGWLRAGGLAPEQPVAVLTGRSVDLAVGMLAALRAGGAYLPLDPAHPPARVAAMLDAAGCPAVLTRTDLAGRYAGATLGRRVLLLDRGDGQPEEASGTPRVQPERLAYVIFTSGSTGTPKGVAVEHRSIVHYLHAVMDRLDPAVAAGAGFAQVSTPAADLGLTCLLGSLVTGATLHLVDQEVAVDPHAFAGYLAGNRVDVLKLVPSHLALLAAHRPMADLLPRRLLILAGEACGWELVARVREARPDLAVQSHYGPTETTVAGFCCDVDEVPPAGRTGTVPLGRPLSNVIAHVVDGAGRPLPAGVPGELVIGGPGVARGYLGDGSRTAERFTADPLAAAGRCYRTGDRVRVRPDGQVDFLGRVDDQVKIRGYRVEPGEVVAACRALPDIADAAVLPAGAGGNDYLAAWLVPRAGTRPDLAAVRAALRQRLPDHAVPAAFVVLDALPLTANGKLDRAALPPPDPDSGQREAPVTAAERRVAGAWRAVLQVPEVGRDDDFFALGGDSFAAVRTVRTIGGGLRVIDLFTHPTVRELAALLEDAPDRDAGRTSGLLHRLSGPPPDRPAAVTLVCVPYGGGSAATYQPLADALPGDVAVLAVELPGHDPARPDESLLPLDELVERCATELAARRGEPLLVYGHCVGTAAAVALARRLEADGHRLTGVVLGASFPTARLPGRLSALMNRLVPSDRWLSDRSYRDVLRVLGGLGEGTDDPTLLRALRHDAREAEAWFTRELTGPPPVRLRAPVLSVVGERDRTTELYQERFREWGGFAERVALATIPRAGHYFLRHQAERLAGIVTGAMADWRAGRLPPPVVAGPVTGPEARRGLRAFALVAAGQFASMVGTQLSSFALGVFVFQRTGRIFDFALITMLALVPAIAAAPVGGALTDRYDRRRVMLLADLASAVAMACLVGLLWLDRLALWHILLVVTAGSLATAVQRPAYLAAIAQLVPKPYLPQANAVAQFGTGAGTLLAPLVGGTLIVLVGLPAVIMLDMGTFLIGAVTLLAVRFPRRLFRRRDESFGAALTGGWRFIARRRPFALMIGYFVPVNYLAAVTLVLITPLVLGFGSPVTLGVVTAVGGLGAVVGSLMMVAWGGTRRRADGMIGFVSLVGAGTLLLGVHPATGPVAAGLFLWWAATSVLNAHWLAILQVKVGLELQGRVLAVNQMLATAMMPLGFVSAPALARLIDPGAALVGSGALLVAWGVLGLWYRPLRHLEDSLPDAVAGPEIAEDLDELQAEIDARLAPDRREWPSGAGTMAR
jgi:amino acid adenylation domain-containing protein